MGLNERAESRFVWNKALLHPFQSQNLKSYCLPLIHGCKNIIRFYFTREFVQLIYSLSVVSINQLTINNHPFTLILVSRRSVQRAGTRLFSRGIDRNVSSRPKNEVVIFFVNIILVSFRVIAQILLKQSK